MNIFGHFGAWILSPFIAISLWLGGGMHVPPSTIATSTQIVVTGMGSSTVTSTTSTSIISPAHPIRPLLPPVTTSTSIKLISVTPTTAQVGQSVTLVGTGFTSDSVVLMKGMLAAKNFEIQQVNPTEESITFTVPNSMGAYCKADVACPMFALLVTNGSYGVTVVNNTGVSNAINLNVEGGTQIQIPQAQ